MRERVTQSTTNMTALQSPSASWFTSTSPRRRRGALVGFKEVEVGPLMQRKLSLPPLKTTHHRHK